MAQVANMLIKKMSMKFLTFILFVLISVASCTHQHKLSTVVVSKTTDGKYVMQVTSSLTAFEGEVDYLYGKNSYKTPDEFSDLVIGHFRKNVSFFINDRAVQFVNPEVLLGHETKLVVEVQGMPRNINTIDLKNTMFKDMSLNQSVVMLVGQEFPNQQYILDNNNSQQIQLASKNGKWNYTTNNGFTMKAKNIYLLVLLLLAIPSAYFFFRPRKKDYFNFA